MPARRTVEEFSADLERAARALDVSLEDALAKVTFDLLRGVVLRNPVDTGASAGNWAVTQGPSAEHHAEAFIGDRAAAEQRALGTFATVRFSPPYGTWWVSNFLPYIEVLEFGGYRAGPRTVGGFSRQAPAGMVRITLAEIETEIDEILRRATHGAGL